MQREFGGKIGLAEVRVRHIETGKYGGVRQPVFRRLATLLGTDVDGLRDMIEKWQRDKMVKYTGKAPRGVKKPPRQVP